MIPDALDPTSPRPARAAAAVPLIAFLFLGCSGEASSAQEAVVPADPSVVQERADRSRVKGEDDAPLRIVEVSDFQCPFCAQFYRETYPALDSLYIETGKARYIFVTFPNSSHRLAWPAIEAALCAGAVGQFWEMHDLLFERQDQWSGAGTPAEVFRGYAEELGIDGDSFAACVENDRTAPLQVRDLTSIVRAGISSTPFFIINDEVSIQGAAPIDNFRTVLDSAYAAETGGG